MGTEDIQGKCAAIVRRGLASVALAGVVVLALFIPATASAWSGTHGTVQIMSARETGCCA
jgi:hypothetical protein